MNAILAGCENHTSLLRLEFSSPEGVGTATNNSAPGLGTCRGRLERLT